MINVLYIVFASDHFDGATYSLMDLIKSVKNEVNPIILVPKTGVVFDYFVKHGIECIAYDFRADLCTDPRTLKQYGGFFVRYFKLNYEYYSINKKCIKKVTEKLKDRNIDIVHINSTVLSIGYDIAKQLKSKLIWHLRGFMDLDFGWRPLVGWKKYKMRLYQSDAIIGITNTVLSHFIPSPQRNAFPIFDAVRSVNETSYNKDKEKYFLFCAGFLTSQKGCDFSIKAFAESQLYKKGYKLRIIGRSTDKYDKYIRSLIDALNIKQHVEIIPFTEDIKTQMEHATALLMCSENEGLGRVSVEAMFYGCPVIGRNSGGTKDFVFHNKNGFLFNSIDECASCMNWVVDNDTESLIGEAHKFVKENFSIEIYGEKILGVYNYVMNH